MTEQADDALDDETDTRAGRSLFQEGRASDRPPPGRPTSDRPTSAAKPTARAEASSSGGAGTAKSGPSAASAVSSPREALLLVEIRRTHTFAKLVAATVVFVVITLFAIRADPVARWVHVIGIAPAFVLSSALAFVLRDPARYRPWMPVVFAGCCGLGIASTFFFWGVFSSGVVIVPIALYFFASGTSRASIVAVLVGSVVPHAAMGLLIVTGVVADRAVIRPVDLGPVEATVVLAIAQFIFGIAFFLARAHHRSTQEAMERLEQAARGIAQREALLQEAKQELDRALRIGGPGRFSEQTIGSFRLGNLLGRGAMGDVYEAVHVTTSEPAAVKLLAASAARDPQLVERFLREVKIAAAVDVPNVVRVLETPKGTDGIPFLAMERLRGETLADVLRERPRLSLDETIELVRGLGRGLGAAHAAGIVHRDIKPQNVFAHREGSRLVWKILDFGVSRLTGAETLTKDQLVGTPTYMAPEQAEGEQVDGRADLYSLGVIAYRALTGRPAFTGKDAAAVLFKVVGSLPPAPSSSGRLPPDVDLVLAVAMAKRASHRFESAEQMIAAFEALGRGEISDELRKKAALAMRACPWGGVVDRSVLD